MVLVTLSDPYDAVTVSVPVPLNVSENVATPSTSVIALRHDAEFMTAGTYDKTPKSSTPT
jgi:hypothetical protein